MDENNISASEKQEAVIQSKAPEESKDDFMLPDGWAEGDDIFNPEAWTGQTPEVDAQTDEAQGDADDFKENAEAIAAALTNGQATDTETPESEEKADAEPTTPEAADDSKLKFIAQFDHKDIEVELDKEELPAVWQKAQIVDRVQNKLKETSATMSRMDKLAKYLEYDNIDDFYRGTIDNLINQEKDSLMREGVHEAVATDVARRRVADLLKDAPPEEPKEAEDVPAKRDFSVELQDLYKEHPEAIGKQIPDEIIKLTAGENGKSLLRAYEAFYAQQTKAELEALRKENKILKQNADAAKRAPVKGVTSGGATNKEPDDYFLKGFTFED